MNPTKLRKHLCFWRSSGANAAPGEYTLKLYIGEENKDNFDLQADQS